VPQVSVAGGRSDNPAQQEGLPAAVQGALPVFNQAREVRRPHASVPRPRYSAVKVEQRALRAIPDRTGLNTAHGTARSIAIAMTVIVAMVVVFMVVGVVVMMVMAAVGVPFVGVTLVALAFALAPHLHDVVWASGLRQR
jgi:hypothetical protein